MTDAAKRKKLLKWLDDVLKRLKTLTVSAYYQSIEALRDYIMQGGDFEWNEYGSAEKRVTEILKILQNQINILIANGVSTWYQEGLTTAIDNTIKSLKGGRRIKREREIKKIKKVATQQHRTTAAIGHATYRDGAINNLSNRVWDFKEENKKIIEKIVQDAIRDGKGVNETKNSVKEYLNTDGNGKMKKTGAGVYKNPLKNCERLMRTEVNAAYRSAEIDSYNAMDVVLGYEIHLSGNHYTTRKNKPPIPIHDICDECAGKYPKNFIWFGWHPNCRCYITPITMTPEQFAAYMDAEDEGREKEYLDSITIKDFPDGFKKYFSYNASNIINTVAKNPKRQLPSWFENNKKILPVSTDPKIQERLKEFNNYNSDPDYTDVKFDAKTGGLMATHKEHKKHPNDTQAYNIKGELLTADDLENNFKKVSFNKGHKVIFKKEDDNKKDLDMYLDDVLMDLASITDNHDDYRSALWNKNKQLKGYNHRHNTTENESVCLYFHDPSHFSYEKIVKGLQYVAKHTKRVRIKKVYVMLNDDSDLQLFEFP